MKKLICCLLLLLFISPVFAQEDDDVVVVGGVTAGVSYPGFDYDVVEDFEDALAGEWSEDDSGGHINPQDASAEYRGTYGASNDGVTGEWGILWNPASANKTTLSIGLWYKSGDYASWAGLHSIIKIWDDGSGIALEVREGNNAGTNNREVGWSPDGDIVNIADNTWYWITVLFNKNSTCQASVYNTAGSQVGSTMSGTCPNYDADEIRFFNGGPASSVPLYLDEIYIDLTDSTFPLGPPTGS